MDQLNKHILHFDTTWEYAYQSLHEVNTLSSELLNLVDFKKGSFFTLLPTGANLERLYEFKAGLILPQYPEEEYFVNGRKATFTRIPTIEEELSELILNEVRSKELCCIFDDVIRLSTDKNHEMLFKIHGLSYGNEIYYFLEKRKISNELVVECLRASTAIWHSLCVLTKKLLIPVNIRELNIDLIKQICTHVDKIMIGAYDGEGYIFWEKIE